MCTLCCYLFDTLLNIAFVVNDLQHNVTLARFAQEVRVAKSAPNGVKYEVQLSCYSASSMTEDRCGRIFSCYEPTTAGSGGLFSPQVRIDLIG